MLVGFLRNSDLVAVGTVLVPLPVSAVQRARKFELKYQRSADYRSQNGDQETNASFEISKYV